jgi:hypothetical protein
VAARLRAGSRPDTKTWPGHPGEIGTYCHARVDVDLDPQTGRLHFNGQDMRALAAPQINAANGPLGLRAVNFSACKNVHIRIYDPGEAFVPVVRG